MPADKHTDTLSVCLRCLSHMLADVIKHHGSAKKKKKAMFVKHISHIFADPGVDGF